MNEDVKIADHAALLTHFARVTCGSDDPRVPFVTLMTAAALAGLFIERDEKECHDVLEKVWPAAVALLADIDGETIQ